MLVLLKSLSTLHYQLSTILNYLELKLTLSPDFTEILMAELAELGFESFVETDEGLDAYIVETDFAEEKVSELLARYQATTAIGYSWQALEKKNWNEEWGRAYEPIEVGEAKREWAVFERRERRWRQTSRLSYSHGVRVPGRCDHRRDTDAGRGGRGR